MTSRFRALCVDCHSPRRLAEFWGAVLGWDITVGNGDEAEVTDPEGGFPSLLFLRVPEAKTVKNRLHIDVSPRDRINPKR